MFSHYSVILATHSDYVDAMLSSPMAENETRALSFPDIEPVVWQKMLYLLEDPSKARRASVKDAMQTVMLYDKYQFPKGKKLCSDIFVDYFEQLDMIERPDLETLVEVILLAEEANLEDCVRMAVATLEEKLLSPELRILFTENQITKLLPLIGREERLLSAVNATAEDLRFPAFARFLIQSFQLWQSRQNVQEAYSGVALVCPKIRNGKEFVCPKSKVVVDVYMAPSTVRWRSSGAIAGVQFSVEREASRDWVVCGSEAGAEKKPFWRCPQSGNMDLPPRRGWERVDEAARGEDLTLLYTFNNKNLSSSRTYS